MLKTKTPVHLSKKAGLQSKKTGQEIIRFFYKFPSKQFTVRELATKTKMSKSTVQYRLQALKSQGIISAQNKWVDSWPNRLRKTFYYIDKIIQSGLIDYLEHEFAASAIIIFGSFSKGESIKGSDIDIFVECAREKEYNLRKFEKKLGHNIELITRSSIMKLPKRLRNNVVNGIKLKGYFTIE
jgi:predicted nucleotidyltransferase